MPLAVCWLGAILVSNANQKTFQARVASPFSLKLFNPIATNKIIVCFYCFKKWKTIKQITS